MARRGFGDETWRLAEAGDAAALARAAALLGDGDDGEYEGRRAAAFRLALEGRTQEALAELNEGWSDDWPPPSAYALDVARIHFLAGDTNRCLTAIELELRGLSRWDGVGALVVASVRRDPRCWRRAFGLVLRAERGPRKLRSALAVVRAGLGRRPLAAVAAATPES
jgi:hypothetical protein